LHGNSALIARCLRRAAKGSRSRENFRWANFIRRLLVPPRGLERVLESGPAIRGRFFSSLAQPLSLWRQEFLKQSLLRSEAEDIFKPFLKVFGRRMEEE
jgi:hypothetical protein